MSPLVAKRSQLAISTALVACCSHAAWAEDPLASLERTEQCGTGEDGKVGACASVTDESLGHKLADDASSLLQTRHTVAEVNRHGSVPDEFDSLDKIVRELRSDPVINPAINPVPDFDTTACYLDDASSNGCKLSDMTPGDVYDVYPHKSSGTACLTSSSPYYFQVRRGPESVDKEKLMIYFQGGGACWDLASYSLNLCWKNTRPSTFDGILNNSQVDNPYRDYTIVFIIYCSGDMHIGNRMHFWDWLPAVQQRGYNNANSAISWAMEQFDSSLSSVALVGCSAGSLGVQFWSDYLLSTLDAKFSPQVTTLIADSFIGMLQPLAQDGSLEGKLFSSFGACSAPIFTPAIQALCNDQKLTLEALMLGVMDRYPLTQFTMINSKDDHVQIPFEKFFALTVLDINGALMTAPQYYKDVNLILAQYRKRDNFWVYLVNGTQHCYTCDALFWTTTPIGPKSYPLGSPSLASWSISFVDGSSNEPPVICEGESKSITKSTPAGKTTEYCDSNILPQ